jgi:hypothetical protein
MPIFVNANNNIFQPDGSTRISPQPGQLLYTGFDAGLDVNIWNTAVAAGGGVAALNEAADTKLGTGIIANGYSYIRTTPTFPPVNPGWLEIAYGNNIPFPYVANTYLFWGMAFPQAVPTAANPISDGAGWEVFTDGKLYAVIYQGGTRNFFIDCSSTGIGIAANKMPLDASVHYYYIYYRGDQIYWAIDNPNNFVAYTTTGAPGPNFNTLPGTMMAVAGTVGPVSSGVLTCNVVHISDTTNRAQQIADGTYPWRKLTVDASGNLLAKLAAGASIIGTVNQGTGAAAGTSWRTAGDFTEIVGTPAAANNALLIASTDVSSYKWLSFHTGSTAYVGTLNFECSNDNINWTGCELFQSTSLSNATTNVSNNNNNIWHGPAAFRFFRIRMSPYTSGTANGILELYTSATSYLVNTVFIGTGTNAIGTVQPGNTPNTTPWLTMPNGATIAVIAAGAAGPTVIKASTGIYYGTLLTTSAAGAPQAFDNAAAASGNIVAAIPASAAVGYRDAPPMVGERFVNGLTYVGGATMPAMTVFFS